jgi:hypothetical protein
VTAVLTRTREELILENAFLRQQLVILGRQVKRPRARHRERVLLASQHSKLEASAADCTACHADPLISRLVPLAMGTNFKAAEAWGRPPLLKGLVNLIQRMAREN